MSKQGATLEKAQDLLKVGQKEGALKVLQQGVLRGKYYEPWTKDYESVLELQIDLSSELKSNCRDVLMAYRGICGANHMQSLERVLGYYQKVGENSALKASEEAKKLENDDVDDSFESKMLTLVSGETNKQRISRKVLTPQLKYLWETYRTILEVVRNYAKLTNVYHTTARKAFQFCIDYDRAREFKILCQLLRDHISSLQKYKSQPHSVDINDIETHQMYLETRYKQMCSALDLGLWQEAHKTIEDISIHFAFSDDVATPEIITGYFEKVAGMFWEAENLIIHGYALLQFYNLVHKSLNQKQKEILANRCIIAALIVSPVSKKANKLFENIPDERENMRILDLLHFEEAPERSVLLNLLQKQGILDVASKSTQALFHLVENHYGPLELKNRFDTVLKDLITEDTSKYVQGLRTVIVVRLLEQLSEVFKTISYEQFLALSPDMDELEVECIVMEIVRNGHVSLALDHSSGMIYFKQDEVTDQSQDQLYFLAKGLQECWDLISSEDDDMEEIRAGIYDAVKVGLKSEHVTVFDKIDLTERRKEAAEKAEEERRIQEAEDKRIAEEKRIKEFEETKQSVEKEQEEREFEKKQKKIRERELKLQKELEKATKEKEEENKQLTKDIATYDYFIRATREIAKPYWIAQQKEDEKMEVKFQEHDKKRMMEQHKNRFERKVADKHRLAVLDKERQAYADKLVARAKSIAWKRFQKQKQNILAHKEHKEEQARIEAERIAEQKRIEEEQKIEEERIKKEQKEALEQQERQERIQRERQDAIRKRRDERDSDPWRKPRENAWDKPRQNAWDKPRENAWDRPRNDNFGRDNRPRNDQFGRDDEPEEDWGRKKQQPVIRQNKPIIRQQNRPVNNDQGAWRTETKAVPKRTRGGKNKNVPSGFRQQPIQSRPVEEKPEDEEGSWRTATKKVKQPKKKTRGTRKPAGPTGTRTRGSNKTRGGKTRGTRTRGGKTRGSK